MKSFLFLIIVFTAICIWQYHPNREPQIKQQFFPREGAAKMVCNDNYFGKIGIMVDER